MTGARLETAAAVRGERIVAVLIDFTVLCAVTVAVWFTFAIGRSFLTLGLLVGSAEAGAPPGLMSGAILLDLLAGLAMWGVIALLVGGYFAYFQSASGRTPGMSVMDVTVVDEAGGSCSFKQAVVRTAVLLLPLPLMALLSELVPLVGFLLALLLMGGWLGVEALVLAIDDDARRLGDRIAGTRVVESGG